jgi:hypothetical protein
MGFADPAPHAQPEEKQLYVAYSFKVGRGQATAGRSSLVAHRATAPQPQQTQSLATSSIRAFTQSATSLLWLAGCMVLAAEEVLCATGLSP